MRSRVTEASGRHLCSRCPRLVWDSLLPSSLALPVEAEEASNCALAADNGGLDRAGAGAESSGRGALEQARALLGQRLRVRIIIILKRVFFMLAVRLIIFCLCLSGKV